MKPILNPNYNLYQKDNKAVCDSLQVAETFGRQHKHILATIQRLTEPTSGLSEEFRTSNFTKSNYKDGSGKRNPKYYLTKDGFVMVTMEFKTVKARQFKEAYIRQFNAMAEFITVLGEVREDFPEFAEVVKLSHPDAKPYHYSNEVNMLYSIVLGQSVQSYRKQHGIEGSIRDHLTLEQLLQLRKLQRADIGLMLAVPDISQRKRFLCNMEI